MKKPEQLTWEDCIRLSQSPEELDEYLNARLVSLTKEGGTVAIRAIEALKGIDVRENDNLLAGFSIEELYLAKQRALDWLNSQNGGGDGG